MINLPELGVGVVYAPALEPLLEVGQDLIDVIEIEPQPFWFKSRLPGSPYRLDQEAFKRFLDYPQRKLVHGVGFPIGGTTPLGTDYLPAFVQSIERVSAPWASEHLSFNRVNDGNSDFNAGFLLPSLQTKESVAVAAANIRQLCDHLPVPFAFETGVNYLQPFPGEMPDGSFFAEVAEAANCGILLDLHNLWTNQQNGRQSVLDALAMMPLERVWEVHLAGGQAFQGYWLDAHSDLVPLPVMELAAQIIPYLPNLKALIFEIMNDYILASKLRTDDFIEQIQQIRQLWDRRSRRIHSIDCLQSEAISLSSPDNLPSPTAWEVALGRLVIGRSSEGTLSIQLGSDPGVEVLRQLVSNVRASTTVDAMKLTCRLLMLHLGESGFYQLLEDFWQSTPPEPFATEESRNFAAYLKTKTLSIPHLEEVSAFELALQQVFIEACPRIVHFSCDPIPLLSALGEGRLLNYPVLGEFELVIHP